MFAQPDINTLRAGGIRGIIVSSSPSPSRVCYKGMQTRKSGFYCLNIFLVANPSLYNRRAVASIVLLDVSKKTDPFQLCLHNFLYSLCASQFQHCPLPPTPRAFDWCFAPYSGEFDPK